MVPASCNAAIMAGFQQYGPPYDNYALEVTWRLSYAIGLIPLIGILFYRIFRLRESAVWQKKREALKAMGGEFSVDRRCTGDTSQYVSMCRMVRDKT